MEDKCDEELSQEFKCIVADEICCALSDENRTIEDSEYKDYLKIILLSNYPFNDYYYENQKYKHKKLDKHNTLILAFVFLAVFVITAILSIIINLSLFITESIAVIVYGFIIYCIYINKRKSETMHYISVIKNSSERLEAELKITDTPHKRRMYLASLLFLCNYINR